MLEKTFLDAFKIYGPSLWNSFGCVKMIILDPLWGGEAACWKEMFQVVNETEASAIKLIAFSILMRSNFSERFQFWREFLYLWLIAILSGRADAWREHDNRK